MGQEQHEHGARERVGHQREPLAGEPGEHLHGPASADDEDREPELEIVGEELAVEPDGDGRRQQQREPEPARPPGDHQRGEQAAHRGREAEQHEGAQSRLEGRVIDVERAPDEGQHVARVEAVVDDDRLPERVEPPDGREVAERRGPRRRADDGDRGHVGEGPASAPALGRPRDVGEREERGRRDHDLLVERGEREERADREEASGAGAGAGPDEEREGPDDARVHEDLRVRLVGLEPYVAGGHGPERGRPEPRAPREGRAGDIDTHERGDGREHVEGVHRGGSAAQERHGDHVARVEGRRLVVPEVGVERAAAEHLAREDGGAGDVGLERLVVGVQPRHHDHGREQREHEDPRPDPSHRLSSSHSRGPGTNGRSIPTSSAPPEARGGRPGGARSRAGTPRRGA